MREIKFRGMTRGGYFVYGLLTKKRIRNSGELAWAIAAAGNFTGEETVPVIEETIAQFLGHDSNGVEIYEGDIYFDGDTQTQTHAPCIDDLVNEALGDNFVSLNYHEMERAKKTLVEATS